MKKQIFEKMDNSNLLTQFDEEEFQKLWDNFEWKHKYLKPIRHFMNYIPKKEYKGVEKMESAKIKKQEEVYFNELEKGDVFTHKCKAFIKTRVTRTVSDDGHVMESNAVSLHSGIGYWFDISDKVEKAKVFIPLVAPKEPNPEPKEPEKPLTAKEKLYKALFEEHNDDIECDVCGDKLDYDKHYNLNGSISISFDDGKAEICKLAKAIIGSECSPIDDEFHFEIENICDGCFMRILIALDKIINNK